MHQEWGNEEWTSGILRGVVSKLRFNIVAALGTLPSAARFLFGNLLFWWHTYVAVSPPIQLNNMSFWSGFFPSIYSCIFSAIYQFFFPPQRRKWTARREPVSPRHPSTSTHTRCRGGNKLEEAIFIFFSFKTAKQDKRLCVLQLLFLYDDTSWSVSGPHFGFPSISGVYR